MAGNRHRGLRSRLAGAGAALVWLAASAAPLPAQSRGGTEAPLQFGIEYGRATPRGDFAGVVDAPSGFSAWMALPFTRRSALGLRGEFSVFTLAEQVATQSLDLGNGTTGSLELDVRGTIGFTGAGPRLAVSLGPLAAGAHVMVGVLRVITDISAVATVGVQSLSDAASLSDFTVGYKAGVDGYLALFRGIRGTSLGVGAGVDVASGGPVGLVRGGSLTSTEVGFVATPAVVRPTMLILRIGLAATF